jgi:putative heme-binding domain-containing protein
MRAKLLVFCLLCTLQGKAATPEPWSDAGLPVREGLEIWLDANREGAARAAHHLPVLTSGAPLDYWHDASGHKRNVSQRIPEARPKLIVAGTGTYLAFDGKDDALTSGNLGTKLTNASIFILAAPRSNAGFFRGLLAINAEGRNDYVSGLNIDLGPAGSPRFSSLNIEGSGFGGAAQLISQSSNFGSFHLLEVLTEPAPAGTRLWLDGTRQGERSREAGTLGMDEITIGARCYSNGIEAPFTQGSLDGGIAEVLIYNRILTDAERGAVEKYLSAKKSELPDLASLTTTPENPIVTVSNAPPFQVLLPGFTVRELPVHLPNINNIKYRADGRLVASGYNGQIFLLTDSNGDGLEDKASIFWDKPSIRAPIGMALTPPGYARGEGVFLAAKGKLSLIVDTNHDGLADQEITVASGWKELGHGVDALGVALDKQGNIYFGLGCANFTDAYLIDKNNGKSHYDLQNERGTIMRVSPDFSKREILCTGIRFPVAMAFNREGDLFSTDQEGATWLPNGNPFDELLQIQPGRHYGFPPRHPKHLPNVIDEPSVFDYTPQHQSTCGLNFDESVNGGPVFGPSWWRGDALVTGYSRGKLYRTKLVKTDAGYVAQNETIGVLNMLTIDDCVSPRGELVVSVHSGAPDWGSGPNGMGKLYKVFYTGTNLAQPGLTWFSSPAEIRIAFDRPLQLETLKELSKYTAVTAGKFVSAGDRFESIRPGYQAVQNQLAAARSDIPVLSTGISQDRRTLILTIAPQKKPINYAITLPGIGRLKTKPDDALPQIAAIDLQADLHGVEASWQGKNEHWSGWLPHVNLAVARELTRGSSEQEALWKNIASDGTLILRAQFDLSNMLRPALQPGSEIDYAWPPEKVTVAISCSSEFSLNTLRGSLIAKRSGSGPGRYELTLDHEAKDDPWLAAEILVKTGTAASDLQVDWFTNEDPRHRALPLRRILLPWVSPDSATTGTKEAPAPISELAGGNWSHGKHLFFGEKLSCYKCHQIRGEGGQIGPDLSNLIHRDYASVFRDITEPNATINPEHIAYNLELKNADSVAGIIKSDTAEQIIVADASGNERPLRKDSISSMNPSTVSLMPEGLLKELPASESKDLLTFLLSSPLDPAAIEITGEPPARSRAELNAILRNGAARTTNATVLKPIRILLAAGPKDHGVNEHDYPLWQERWLKLFGVAENVKTETAFDWPKSEQFQNADVIIFYSNNPGWSIKRASELDAFLNRGGGLVYLHYAVDGHNDAEALSQRIGLAWRGGAAKFRHGPLDLKIEPSHPLAGGFSALKLIDESYWQLTGDPKNINLLASGIEDGIAQPLIWTREQGKGRIFVSIPGHYTWTFDDPLFRVLILRGIAWCAKEPIDRFSELAAIGARIGN